MKLKSVYAVYKHYAFQLRFFMGLGVGGGGGWGGGEQVAYINTIGKEKGQERGREKKKKET